MPSDPTLFLYTSLTAGSSHIITATSRIETILKANKIPFKAVDIATDDKARLIWQRRSKGKKIPGLVKFNDVIADFEQIEEWNEYGELEDEIEAVIDIFGDVPVSSTSAEAQAAAAERAKAQSQPGAGSSQARTASETRHISISEPTGDRKKSENAVEKEKNESPMSMAMRQAGAEAAAKAGLKQNTPPASTAAAASVPAATSAASTPAATSVAVPAPPTTPTAPAPAPATKKPVDVTPETKPSDTPTTLPESQEPIPVTDAKTPTQLASEGAPKISLDKVKSPLATEEDASTGQSTLAQTLDQRRKSSVPTTPSALSKSTSISDAHTIPAPSSTDAPKPSSPRLERPRTEHRGSSLDPASAEVIKEAEKRNSIKEEEEESSEEESEDDEEEEEEKVVKDGKKVVGATDKQEEKVTGTGKQKTQEQGAKDIDKVGVSVGD